MNLEFTSALPLGEPYAKIIEVISKELKHIRSRNNPALGDKEDIHSDDFLGVMNYSFIGSVYGKSGGSVTIGQDIISFKLAVPDCNPFRFVVAENFIHTFKEVKIPHEVSV